MPPFDSLPAETPITTTKPIKTPLELLKATRDYLVAHPNEWCQGVLAKDKHGYTLPLCGAYHEVAQRCASGWLIYLGGGGWECKDSNVVFHTNDILHGASAMVPDLVKQNDDRDGYWKVVSYLHEAIQQRESPNAV